MSHVELLVIPAVVAGVNLVSFSYWIIYSLIERKIVTLTSSGFDALLGDTLQSNAMSIIENAITFFLITNPIGNSPAILALVKEYDFSRQRFILLREGIFSLIIALLFQYSGEYFLALLHIETYALTLTGGLLLLLVALNMLFHKPADPTSTALKQEPFIVPIATPLMAGPGAMTMIMIKSRLAENSLEVTASILISFAGVIGVMLIAPYFQKLIGKRGLDALEQIMGMILALMATEMIVNGAHLFAATLKGPAS